MDKLRAMRMVAAIADRGSLTAAAEALGTSAPTVVRALAALEEELGVRLFDRTTRRLAPTDDGREYAERCRRVIAEVDEADAALASKQRKPTGLLRVTAPVMLGRLHVAPLVFEFMVRHAGVRVDLVLLDRTVDLVEEGLDVGIRVGDLPESSLVAVAAGHVSRVACASQAYLRRDGIPKTPQDLREKRCIRFTGLLRGHEWEFAKDGRPLRVPIDGALTTNQIDVALEACLMGLGIGAFLSYQVAGSIAAGRLRRVLAEFEPSPRPVHLVRPQGRLLPLRVRAFIDFVTPRLRERLAAASRLAPVLL